MMANKRQRFGVGLTLPLSKSLKEGTSQAGSYVFEVIQTDRIKLDPDNPRRLGLDVNDPSRLDPDDPNLETKQVELAALQELANSISEIGVQQPIKVYPDDGGYRIAFGERRYLACKLAGVTEIPAWVVPKRPQFLRTIQFVENELRRNLRFPERVRNIESLVAEYQQDSDEAITSERLSRYVGLAKRTCAYYLSILRGPEDIRTAIDQGHIGNLKVAALLAAEDDGRKRSAGLSAARKGLDIDQVRSAMQTADKPRVRTGRPKRFVTLGKVKDTRVIQRLFEAAQSHGIATDLKLDEIEWDEPQSVQQAWDQFIRTIESTVR
jgi:ParB family chromosome partitioning protein